MADLAQSGNGRIPRKQLAACGTNLYDHLRDEQYLGEGAILLESPTMEPRVNHLLHWQPPSLAYAGRALLPLGFFIFLKKIKKGIILNAVPPG